MDFDTQAKALFLKQLEEEAAAKKEARRLQEEALRAQLEAASPMTDVQLAPLAGAIDSAFGTRVAPGIQAAEAKREPSTKKAEDILDSLVKPKADSTATNLLGLARLEQQGASAQAKTEKGDEKTQFANADKLRDDFTKSDTTKEYNKARDGITALRSLGSSPTQGGANDLAIVYAFMKAMDPGSVVREGEVAFAQKAGGLFDQYGVKLDRILGGKDTLSPAQRKSLIGAAETAFSGRQTAYDEFAQQYVDLAKRMGVRPEDVVINVRAKDLPGKQQKTTPPDQDPEIKAMIDGLSKKKGK